MTLSGVLQPPELTEELRAGLLAGQDVVVDRFVDNRPVIYPVRRVGNGILVAVVDPAYLWGALDQGALVPSMQLHVANAASRVKANGVPAKLSMTDPRWISWSDCPASYPAATPLNRLRT